MKLEINPKICAFSGDYFPRYSIGYFEKQGLMDKEVEQFAARFSSTNGFF
ncbi:hypothetical protein [Rhodoflexus caldus]|nr:hypothetical protein [Rhodoflexus caldus]